jgi:MaoC dehydratase-like protein
MPLADPTDIIGLDLGSITVSASRYQLAWFARVIGLRDPVYSDVAAARSAGHPDLLIPPTFFFSLEFDWPDRGRVLRELGIDPRQGLHGEQRFTYHRLAFAREELTVSAHVSDYYEKRGGALRFVRRESEVTRDGEPIATLTNVLVARELVLS